MCVNSTELGQGEIVSTLASKLFWGESWLTPQRSMCVATHRLLLKGHDVLCQFTPMYPVSEESICVVKVEETTPDESENEDDCTSAVGLLDSTERTICQDSDIFLPIPSCANLHRRSTSATISLLTGSCVELNRNQRSFSRPMPVKPLSYGPATTYPLNLGRSVVHQSRSKFLKTVKRSDTKRGNPGFFIEVPIVSREGKLCERVRAVSLGETLT